MGVELSHDAVRELLGAYALDAVDDHERQAVDRHLDGCAACRAEVAEHREVVALLAATWVPAPEGVWDRIAGALEEAPPAMRLAPPAVPLGAARERRRRGPMATVAAIGVAAAVALVAVLGTQIVETNHRVDQVARRLDGGEVSDVAAAAAKRPDARTVAMRSADGRLSADAVVLADGTGYLVRDNLPTLTSDRTYQLWAVVGGAKISVGVLGSEPGPLAFHAPARLDALAVTEEQAGGVVASVQSPTLVGAVPA